MPGRRAVKKKKLDSDEPGGLQLYQLLLDQGGWPAQCFAQSAKVQAKPELARGVQGHAPPENF